MGRARLLLAAALLTTQASAGEPESPFADRVFGYDPAPGQFVNHPDYNDPREALGPPEGYGLSAGNNLTVVSLGGFGGAIVLGFDHTVRDDPLNPLGLDAIVFGNALWAGNATRHWAECATIEISLDANENGLPDDPWYLILGSHLDDLPAQLQSRTWDSNVANAAYPPAHADWVPPGRSGQWQTSGYLLPSQLFGAIVVINPSGHAAEAIWGYADYSPTLRLGDIDADNVVEDLTVSPADFYVQPDDPWTVGITPGSGGGDAFDIAWAVDPATGHAADLPGFDFIRITTAVEALLLDLGEKSAEIDAVADVRRDSFGDLDDDGDIDLWDVAELQACFGLVVASTNGTCSPADRQPDQMVDTVDSTAFIARITGPLN